MSGELAVALVPAAGRGERLGGGIPKAMRVLAGEPMLLHAVRALLAAPSVGQVVVAAPPSELAAVREMLLAVAGAPGGLAVGVLVVAGGPTRVASVGLALAAADPAYGIVLVHDAARPLTPPVLAEAVVAAVATGAEAVVPALPVTDTIKRVNACGQVVATLDRSELVAVQTPQGFRRDIIERAHRGSWGGAHTDDAGMVEAMGLTVTTIQGHADAMKITHPADIVLAEAILTLRRRS